MTMKTIGFSWERAFHKLGFQYRIHAMSGADDAIAYIKGEGKYEDRQQYQFLSYTMLLG